jgi:hypothetical protein
MRSFFLFVCFASSIFTRVSAYKNYTYLSLGLCEIKDLPVSGSQQIGIGYRIEHKNISYIDTTDISISMLTNKATVNTYSQSIFPKVLLLHNFTKSNPFYAGIGAAYLKGKLEKTEEILFGEAPLKIRKDRWLRNIVASMAIGKTIYQSPSMITFAQLDMNIPSAIILDTKNSDFITTSFSINAGF